MSSTEPQNKTGYKRLSSASRHIKIKATHLKIAVCALLAAAVGVTGTFCLSGGLDSSNIVNRSLTEGLNSSAINPQYIERVTRAYSETKPTDPPTEASTKATEPETKKATEKTKKSEKKETATEKATEKSTEKKTEKKSSATAATDPTAPVETEIIEIPQDTQYVQIGASVDSVENATVIETETTPPLTEEEIIARDQLYQQQWDNGYLMAVDAPDYNYTPQAINLSDKDRDLAYRIVMGEMGSEGFIGCAIVAQAIRDTMNLEGYTTIQEVIDNYGYVGSTNITPNQDSIDAVNFIFDETGSAVQHRVLFFYATWITSEWHESQNFVVQYSCVRFFDRWF